jgi:hypothetical protein
MASKFQQRHYKAIAEALLDVKPAYSSKEYDQWFKVAYRLNQLFRADNTNFKPGRFMDACNGTSNSNREE